MDPHLAQTLDPRLGALSSSLISWETPKQQDSNALSAEERRRKVSGSNVDGHVDEQQRGRSVDGHRERESGMDGRRERGPGEDEDQKERGMGEEQKERGLGKEQMERGLGEEQMERSLGVEHSSGSVRELDYYEDLLEADINPILFGREKVDHSEKEVDEQVEAELDPQVKSPLSMQQERWVVRVVVDVGGLKG